MRKRKGQHSVLQWELLLQLTEVTSPWGLLEMCLEANLVLETYEK